MIWRGQIKAIMAIIVVVGLAISFSWRSPWPFLVLVVLVPVVLLGMGTLNTLSTAFRGKPLIYDVKVMPTDTTRNARPSSPGDFCVKCGAAFGAEAQFCSKCGTQRTPVSSN